MRLASTLVESFRLMQAGVKSADDVVAQILRTAQPTARMLVGRDYDAILEAPDTYRVPGGYVGPSGVRFDAENVEPALATVDRGGLGQVKHVKAYGPHQVVAVVDRVRGRAVTEHKVRVGRYEAARYIASYQWRLQLDVFDATEVTYRVFRLSPARRRLTVVEPLTLYRYPALASDCARLVEACAAWVERQGLADQLPDRDVDEGLVAREAPPTLPLPPFHLRPVAPVAGLPDPSFRLRPPSPAGRAQQRPLLFDEGRCLVFGRP